MTPPNYFRWIKTADSSTPYDGYTLNYNESYESAFQSFQSTPTYSDSANDAGTLKHDEAFESNNSDLDAGWPTADASA